MFSHRAEAMLNLEVMEGAEAFEMDTGKVFMLGQNDWMEV